MKILLIEDSVSMGKAIKTLLETQGHVVQWIIGLRSVSADSSNAIGIDEADQDDQVTPQSIDVAFVDGQLAGQFTGPQVVSFLAANSVPCLGISTQSDLNQEMVTLGAKLGLKKPVAFVALVAGLLTPELLLNVFADKAKSRRKKANALKLQQLLAMETKLLTAEFETIRKQADEYYRPFLMEEFK